MAALDFPSSPVNGQLFIAPSGVAYTFYSTPAPGYWKAGGAGGPVYIGTSPPSPATNGMLWWHSETGVMFIYYNDGSTAQWVPASPAGSQAQGWRLISRQTTSGSSSFVDVRNLPLDINDIEVTFNLIPDTNAQNCMVQWYNPSDVLENTAAYTFTVIAAGHTTSLGGAPGVAGSVGTGFTGAILLNYGNAGSQISSTSPHGIRGKFTVPNIRGAGRATLVGQSNYLMTGDTVVMACNVFGDRGSNTLGISGFRMFTGAGNWRAGGVVSVWGSP